MTRASHENANPAAFPAQGRPLGLMAAWLKCAHYDFVETADDHHAMVAMMTRGDRQDARAELLLAHNGAALATREREKRGDEEDEPLELP